MRHAIIAVLAGVLAASGVSAEGLFDAALRATPQTFPVEIACSNDYGRIAGVNPVFIEGEPWHGKPTRVFAWWGLPAGASAERKVPAMVLVHGGGGTAFARWVKTWNDRGYAAIAMDTCAKIPQGERDGKKHNRHPWSGPDGWGESLAQIGEPEKDQWTYHAVSAVIRCHTFLRSRPEVDASRTGLTGISWGGYLTSIIGSVDSRYVFAVPVYGCGYLDINPETWSKGFVARFGEEKTRAWFAQWDPKRFLGGARIPFMWCCGTNDRFYTLEAVQKSYELLGPSAPLSLSLKLRMPHAHPPAGDPKEITALADAYLKGGLPFPKITKAECADGKLHGAFTAPGRKVVRAELLFTCSTDPIRMKREWKSEPVADFNGAGSFTVPVPKDVVMFFANIVTDDGLVVSTRIFPEQAGVKR